MEIPIIIIKLIKVYRQIFDRTWPKRNVLPSGMDQHEQTRKATNDPAIIFFFFFLISTRHHVEHCRLDIVDNSDCRKHRSTDVVRRKRVALRLVDYIYIKLAMIELDVSSSSTCVALYCVFEKEREKKRKKKTEFIGEKNRHRRYDRGKETLRHLSNL